MIFWYKASILDNPEKPLFYKQATELETKAAYLLSVEVLLGCICCFSCSQFFSSSPGTWTVWSLTFSCRPCWSSTDQRHNVYTTLNCEASFLLLCWDLPFTCITFQMSSGTGSCLPGRNFFSRHMDWCKLSVIYYFSILIKAVLVCRLWSVHPYYTLILHMISASLPSIMTLLQQLSIFVSIIQIIEANV